VTSASIQPVRRILLADADAFYVAVARLVDRPAPRRREPLDRVTQHRSRPEAEHVSFGRSGSTSVFP
jgi:hypothetical protein